MFVTIHEKHVDAFANVNNRGTRYIGPTQFLAGVQLHNLLGVYETTNAEYETVSNTSELQYGQFSSNVPIGSEGLVIGVGGNYARARPGWTLASLDLDSRIVSASVNLLYPIFRTRESNWTLNASLLGRNYTTDSLGQQLSQDNIREITLGITYDFADSFLHGAVNLINLGVGQGLSGLGSTPENSKTSSRPGVPPDFTRLYMTLSRLQQLYPSWSWLFAATGQFAGSRLFTSEQFGYGGDPFGRAYDPSELLGDSGVSFRTELQFTPLVHATSLTGTQLYGFYDIGQIWNRHECGCGNPEPQEASGASAGAGVRANLGPYVSASVEVAKPLTRDVATYQNKDARFFGSLTFRY